MRCLWDNRKKLVFLLYTARFCRNPCRNVQWECKNPNFCDYLRDTASGPKTFNVSKNFFWMGEVIFICQDFRFSFAKIFYLYLPIALSQCNIRRSHILLRSHIFSIVLYFPKMKSVRVLWILNVVHKFLVPDSTHKWKYFLLPFI